MSASITVTAAPDKAAFAPISGVDLGTAAAGIRKSGQQDLLVVRFAPGTRIDSVFTRNVFAAAPVAVARNHLQSGTKIGALLFNSGNANAGMGKRGIDDALHCCRLLAARLKLPVEAILPFSTGVIGEPLPTELIARALPQAVADLNPAHWDRAVRAIMTTDTRPKAAAATVGLPDGKSFRLTGIAKGAGMIEPDMATMLALVATDLAVPQEILSRVLRDCVDGSFNRITVDGDTSTNDACVLAATATGNSWNEAYRETLQEAVLKICRSLAAQIIEDAEGLSKPFYVEVSGAPDSRQALKIARAVANSPLVKTAVYARDANWGRILAAVGNACDPGIDTGKVAVYLNGLQLVKNGGRDPDYSEQQGQQKMQEVRLTIHIALNQGDCRETVYAADLTEEYIRINVGYRS